MFDRSFGNFINRVLKFISSQYDGVLPDSEDAPGPLSPNDEFDAEFISDVNALIKDYTDAMESVKLRNGLQTVMLVSARGNLYLQSSGLGKALMTENPKRCAQVVSRALNLIYVLSALAHPFMPATSESIVTQLNAPERTVPDVLATDILAGHRIGTPEHLFKRIDEKMADVWRDKFGGIKPAVEAPATDAAPAGPAISKKKAEAARKAAQKAEAAAQAAIPKSPEVLEWEEKVAEQGKVVRELKGKTPKTEEVEKEITAAVEELKRLKEELSKSQKSSV